MLSSFVAPMPWIQSRAAATAAAAAWGSGPGRPDSALRSSMNKASQATPKNAVKEAGGHGYARPRVRPGQSVTVAGYELRLRGNCDQSAALS